MREAWSFIQNILAPPFCFYCREYGSPEIVLCVSCTQLVKPIISTSLVLSKEYTMQVHAVSAYEDPLKSLILAKGRSDYSAGAKLGSLIWQHSALRNIPFDYLVPVPLHRSRFAYRGFNQCVLIARALEKLSSKPVVECVERTRRTRVQSLFKAVGRHKNVEGAFRLLSEYTLENKVIVLIDDLMTSGATLSQVGKELIKDRPKEIHAVVACRVI